MKITPLNYYPSYYNPEDKFLSGTIHVLLDDIGVELLGIQFIIKEDKSWFFVKGAKGVDHKGKDCYYAYFRFKSDEQKRDFTKSLKESCIPFIEEYRKNHKDVLYELYGKRDKVKAKEKKLKKNVEQKLKKPK